MDREKDISQMQEEIEKVADETKRDFMKKFGNYAASAPLAGFVLMTAGASVAHTKSPVSYHPNNGGGNDVQSAPGKSEEHSNARNIVKTVKRNSSNGKSFFNNSFDRCD